MNTLIIRLYGGPLHGFGFELEILEGLTPPDGMALSNAELGVSFCYTRLSESEQALAGSGFIGYEFIAHPLEQKTPEEGDC